jgi:hypothetical protein
MKFNFFRLVVFLVALGLGGLVVFESIELTPQRTTGEPATPLDEAVVRARLIEAGYDVKSLTLDGGLYEIRLNDGGRLYVDSTDGTVVELPATTGPSLSIAQVAEIIETEGYRLSGSIVWQRGFYLATAEAGDSRTYKLRIDPFSGEIIERTPL